MTNMPTLLPQPRLLTPLPGQHVLRGDSRIVIEAPAPSAHLPAIERLRRALRSRADGPWPLSATVLGDMPPVAVVLRVVAGMHVAPQGYSLVIAPEQIELNASDAAGLFYGVCTLAQLIEQTDGTLPCLRIEDAPDFPVRGVMLDISRDKVPTMATLYELIDMLAGWKINQVQLYTEHTFAYLRHPEPWANASPMTGEEILALDAFCRERFIELVPNQNTFGHMRRWLTLDRYRDLAEAPDGCDTRWGRFDEPFSLNPLDPRSIALVDDMLDELLPHFSSQMINVGCDETVDLGMGRSREACAERGIGRVYFEFLHAIYATVKRRGRTMQYWGDIVLEHPELVPELPKDAVALLWGYEALHPFEEQGQRFAEAGVPFYICPGTSSWCSIAGRTDNALGNLRSAAETGLRHGALGFLNTDWGDLGHWQPLPISYLGFAAGAAFSWAYEANRDFDLVAALDRFAFHDANGVIGRVAYELGNVYQAIAAPANSSIPFWSLQTPLGKLRQQGGLPPLGYFSYLGPEVMERLRAGLRPDDVQHVLDAIDAALAPLAGANMQRSDAELITREFQLAGDMLRHGCHRIQFALGLVEHDPEQLAEDLTEIMGRYQQVWLARNRPGGLADSVGRLEQARADYTLHS